MSSSSDAIEMVAASNRGVTAQIPEPIVEEEEEEDTGAPPTVEHRKPDDQLQRPLVEDKDAVECHNDAANAEAMNNAAAGADADSDTDSDFDLRPVAISDQLKVGKHSGDRATNTDVSEIRPLSEFVANLVSLRDRATELKREFKLTSGFLQAQVEEEIQGRAIGLHSHMNEQIYRLEKSYVKQIDRARMAHRAELEEAIIKVHRMYDKGFGKKKEEQAPQPKQEASMSPAAARQLRNRVLALEAEVTDLREQVAQLNAALATADTELADAARRQQSLVQSPTPPPPPPPPKSLSPSFRQSDIDEYERKLHRLESDLAKADVRSDELEKAMAAAEAALEESRAQAAQLQAALEAKTEAFAAVVEQLEEERRRLGAGASEASAAAAAKARADALAEAEAAAARERREAADRLEALRRALADAEAALAGERRTNAERMEQMKDAERLRRSEEDMRKQLARARSEAKKADLTWEKKFAVLKRSLHAVKDESFVRQTAQRQAAVLHQASVMYAADAPSMQPSLPPQLLPPLEQPLSVTGSRPAAAAAAAQQGQQNSNSRQPQQRNHKGFHEQRAELLSFTASAPGSAGGGGFHSEEEDDENQICSEGEELPAGVTALPDRPEQRRQ